MSRPRPIIHPAAVPAYRSLKGKARSVGMAPDKLITRYALERLLYRLFTGPMKALLVLKGGMVIMDAEGLGPLRGRSTSDVDLHIQNYGENMQAFADLVRMSCTAVTHDGVEFTNQVITHSRVAGVEGGSITMYAHVGGAVVKASIDVTFDARGMAYYPETIAYPSLIGDSTFDVRRVPYASVVADKVQAMVRHAGANTRVRDYYDLFVILSKKRLDPEAVAEALTESLAVFDLDLPASVDAMDALAPEMAEFLASRWEHEKRERGFGVETPPLPEIIAFIREALAPVLEAANRPTCRPAWR